MSEVLYSEYESGGEVIFERIKNHRGTSFMIKKNPEVNINGSNQKYTYSVLDSPHS